MGGSKAKEGGVWWSGGTEPENCIACSVISLPPGSHSLSLPSSNSPHTHQVPFYLSLLFLVSLSCHFHSLSPPSTSSLPSILPYSSSLSSTSMAVVATASPLCLHRPPSTLPHHSSCWLRSHFHLCYFRGLKKCILPPKLWASRPYLEEKKQRKGWICVFE